MTCECRSGATCAEHLEETELELRHVPMGSQLPVCWLCGGDGCGLCRPKAEIMAEIGAQLEGAHE